jgi:hypothetical protein
MGFLSKTGGDLVEIECVRQIFVAAHLRIQSPVVDSMGITGSHKRQELTTMPTVDGWQRLPAVLGDGCQIAGGGLEHRHERNLTLRMRPG